jgi:hypothetical protein
MREVVTLFVLGEILMNTTNKPTEEVTNEM